MDKGRIHRRPARTDWSGGGAKNAEKRIFRPGLQDNQGLIYIRTENVTPQKPVDFSKQHHYY